jgi:hypothetical protein
MAYRRYRRYRGYRRSRAIRAKEIGEHLRKREEQKPILAEIRKARQPYRTPIGIALLNGILCCLGSAICVGIFWWVFHQLPSRRTYWRNETSEIVAPLVWLALVVVFAFGPAYLASRGRISFWLLSIAGTVPTIAMISRASWSYWAYFALASIALFIHLIGVQKEYQNRKADEEELRKRGYDPKDFDLS